MSNAPHPVFALPEWLPHLGGLATFYLHLARCRSELGLPTTVLTTQKEAVDPDWPHVKVVKLADQRYAHFIRYCQWLPKDWEVTAMSLAAGTAMRDWLRANTPDNAVVFAAEFLGYASLLCGKDLPPLVVTAHGSMGQISARSQGGMQSPDAPFLRMLESDALLRADLTTAYSPLNASEWSTTLGRNIPCIDPPFFPYQELDTNIDKTEGGPVRGIVVGRLQDWKGALTLAHALELMSTDERAQLQIDWFGGDTQTAPGGGSLAQWLKKQHPNVFGNTFQWHGTIPREQVLERQAEADFALIPSMWDTLNFTALEAMSAGTPIAISTGAGASYLVENGVTGLTFPADNPQALADTLSRVISCSSQLPSMGEQAKASLTRLFSPKACLERYDKAATQALAARQRPNTGLRLDSAGGCVLPLIESMMQADQLPRRSSRELLSALTQKFNQRLGLDG